MSTKADDGRGQQPLPSSVIDGDSGVTTTSAIGPSTSHHSTELLFEAPRTPHNYHESLENISDVEGVILDGEEWDLDEPGMVNRSGTSVDGNTNLTSYSASQAMSNSPPIVLKSLPTTPNPVTNGHSTYSTQDDDDDEDASKLLISSLRTQLTDLHNQLEMLNSKLVQSYSRISSLEDDLYLSHNNLGSTQARLKSLEQQRQSHIEALQSGALVERAAIATELSRLMERATEEEQKRGEEEGKRKEIEKDLFELSAGLFGQANTMVAEERIARASAQRRVEECEAQIFAQSKRVQGLESTLRALKEERNEFEGEVAELHQVIKAVDRSRNPSARRLRVGAIPYKEYVAFVEHLRALVPSSPTPPTISTLLTLPFLARLVTEDSEPTLRLDTAPSLNWLSRRSVLSAIHHAQLTLEELHIATLFLEANALSSAPSSSSPANAMLEIQMGRVKKVSCALCGTVVWSLPAEEDIPTEHEGAEKWNAPKFLKNVVAAGSSIPVGVGVSPTPGRPNKRAMVRPASPSPPTSLQTVIPVFRITTSSSSSTSNITHMPSASGTPTTPYHHQRSSPYPLCANGWCKERLRTTVKLWKFLREHVVERIWDDETRAEMIIAHQLRQEQRDSVGAPVPPLKVNTGTSVGLTPPPIPPRKTLAGLWGAISGSASPANGISPTASPDAPSGTGVASRSITIGGLTGGLGGFLGRKNSTPNVKLGSSREHSPSPALPPRDARSATSFLGAGLSKPQEMEKTEEKEKLVQGVPVEKPGIERIEQKAQAEEEKPPVVKEAKEIKSEPPSVVGSASLDYDPSGRNDVPLPGSFATSSESVVISHTEMLAEKLGVAKVELESEVKTENWKPVEVPATEAVEHPRTPEPKTETKLDSNEPVPESLAPTEESNATPAPAAPARNPARVVPFGGIDTTKTDSSRPTTPGATIGVPPVPRRAAARGTPRPGSMIITPDLVKPPPPRNERRAVGNVGGEGKEKKEVIVDQKKEAKVEAGVEKQSAAVGKKTEEVIDVAPVTAEKVKEEPKVEVEVPSSTQASPAVPEVAADTATPNTPTEPPLSLPESTPEPASEVPPTTTATGATPADRASIISASSASVYTKDTKDMLPPIPTTASTEEDLPENDEWVGNARWEDRAWNEIVRIREEMFWARVGSGTVGGGVVD